MEFRDLKTQYMHNKDTIDSAIYNVIMKGQFIGGEVVERLEERLARYVGVKHCITCANGTDALLLALMSWNIGEGDAVFVPDFTFFSTAEVVPWVKATPIFVDVELDTFNISVSSLEDAILRVVKEGKLVPKVIVAVDLFGQPAQFEQIRKIAQKYNMLLLEDGAQGFGGSIGERKACSFGDIATTSFFPAKPLGCYGDGGAIFTNNDEWAALIRSYKVHGKGENKYDNVRIGMNSRLDTLQAAILIEKHAIFEKYELKQVNQVADWYNVGLKNVNLRRPFVLNGYESSWAQYTICLASKEVRDGLQKVLGEHNIPSMVYYSKPLHKQKAFKDCNVQDRSKNGQYRNTDELCVKVLSLPIHPYMEEREVQSVVKVITDYLHQWI